LHGSRGSESQELTEAARLWGRQGRAAALGKNATRSGPSTISAPRRCPHALMIALLELADLGTSTVLLTIGREFAPS
jgi:hypothetical protein